MDAHFGSWDMQVPLLLPKSAAQTETLDSDIEERCLVCVRFIITFQQCLPTTYIYSDISLITDLLPCPKYLIKPYNAIFLKSPGSKDMKTDIPNCQIHKYKFTNTQIQLMTKCQKYPTYAIYLNSWWCKDVKN